MNGGKNTLPNELSRIDKMADADDEAIESSLDLSTARPSTPKKGQQVGVDCLRVCCRHPVREILIRLEYPILEEFRG